jgi:hypothetical protein
MHGAWILLTVLDGDELNDPKPLPQNGAVRNDPKMMELKSCVACCRRDRGCNNIATSL